MAFLLAIVLVSAWKYVIGQTIVTTIDPTSGSISGGTRITIYGGGFGDLYTSNAVVFVGPFACALVQHLSSSDVLTCETSPGSRGTYIVTVSVDGQDPVSAWGFTYTSVYTPTLKAVSPSAGPPGTHVFLVGDTTWTLQNQDCVENLWGEVECVGSIVFGDYLCRQDATNENTIISFSDWQGYQRYGYSPYRVGCVMPAPDGDNTQPALGTAGNLNATLHFEASMHGGTPAVLAASFKYDSDGRPYHFQQYAEVTNISPSVGSAAGGTLVEISGRGFPTLSLGLGDTINVSIAGVRCTVVNSTFDTTFCVTSPKPTTATGEEAPIRGLYPGMRGIEYEFYDTTPLPFRELWRLNSTILTSNTAGARSYKTVLTDAWEGPDYSAPNYCSRMKAFFVAPRAGNYRFYMQADDFGQLNATWLQNGTEVSSPIINMTAWSYVDSYFQYAFQSSSPIFLNARQRILLESAHCNNGQIGTQQLAVRMPAPEPRANSLAEVQTVTINSTMLPRQLYVKYLYGAGANTTSYFVNITSLDDSKLDDPRVGLQLVFNGGSVSVVLPLTATSAAMDDAVEAAFGGLLAQPSNNDIFGLRKIRGQGTLTIQLAINSNYGAVFGFNMVPIARIVTINNNTAVSSNTTAAANCIAARPDRYYAPPPPPPAAVPKMTSGMFVVVMPAMPVPAVVPSGNFYLGLPSSDNPLLLSYSTNATEMAAAIYSLTSLDATVSISSTWREGTYFARVWTITFTPSVFNNVPNIVATPAVNTPAGVLLATEVRLASQPLTGSFNLAYGDYCESVSISLTDSTETVRQKLGTLPGMAPPQKVDTTGSPTTGYTYTITFDPYLNPGDQPPLRITDTSGLGGVNPTATVSTNMDGSIDAFYAPIPTEFLQLAVSSPGTISLTANGAPSACAHPSGLCKFDYSTDTTPTITGVSPTALSFNTRQSMPLTITGTLFTAGNVTVTVGASVCDVTSLTATRITCFIRDSAPSGVRLVNVNVAGLGDALGATNVTLQALTVSGTAPAPAVLSSSGQSILNVTGNGFDSVDCSNNVISLGGVRCGVLACNKTFVTVLYPGNGGSDVSAANVTAQVLEAGTVIDQDSPSSLTVKVLGSAPAIVGISTPSTMPASGGLVNVSLAGALPSGMTAMFLVPEISSTNNFTSASAAYQGRLQCAVVTPTSGGTGVSCKAPAVPNGKYHVLVVLSSGLQLLSSETITFDLVITSVTPNAGSIGGGTVLTIMGYGFSPVAAENVVFITVPISSTFPNGIIQCKTRGVTPSTLTCVTQPHLATNADASDPFATDVLPAAAPASPIAVVLCTSGLNTTALLEYCSSLDSTPRARIATIGNASCDYEYAEALTPSIKTVSPAKGSSGVAISISGSFVSDVQNVEFLQGTGVMGLCANVVAGAAGVSCTAPDLPSGVYSIRLKKSNGEMSVDPYGDGVFTYAPIILGLTGNVGSLVGGRNLTLTVGGSGVADGITSGNITNNTVTIGGLACPVVAVANRSSLTCTASGMNGYVYAEYWNLGMSTYFMPDLTTFTSPVLARLEKGIANDWGTGSPLAGALQTDFFGARFTFYLQTVQNDTVTFVIAADDAARLYIDDALLGIQGANITTTLYPGIHKIVITYREATGSANVKLLMSYLLANGSMSTLAAPEWQKVTPVPPGSPLPVRLYVNGVGADAQCAPSTVRLQLPYQPAVSYEPSTVTIPNGTCAYVYTTQQTPTLVSLRPQALNGVNPPTFTFASANLSIYGDFKTDPSIPAAAQLNITVANQTCAVADVSPFVYNATFTTTRIICILPALPVGTWPVNVQVAGLGLTRPPANVATDLPVVTYTLRVMSYTSPPTSTLVTSCWFSMFGGGTFSTTGFGFVKNVTDTVLGRSYTPVWEVASLCFSGGTNTPPCIAAQTNLGLINSSWSMSLIPLTSDGQNTTVRVTRIRVPNPESYAGNNTAKAAIRYRPRITYLYPNTPQFEQAAGADPLYFCGGRTPMLSDISPSTVAPNGGASGRANLTLTWFMSGAGSTGDILRATAVGAPSNATVEFEVGNTTFPCANATVTASTITTISYTEAIRCTLPTYLPAATYTLWLCVDPFGCGLLPTYTVPLSVTSASPLVGSSAGGVVVTLTGNGFDTNVSRVAVRFGNSTCNVTSSTGSTLTCVTGGLDTKPAGSVSAPLFVTPTIGANEVAYPSLTFTFNPSMESSISSISPARGSTEGGTPITIIGSGFVTNVTTNVTISGTPCETVVVVSATTITCTTGKPSSSVLRVPLPVIVYQEGMGNSRSSVTYQYIDLWSRNSTWGGGPLPGFEDSVVIPEGITVLLDISPPKLFMLLVQGNLIFDDTQPYINLQSHYILVVGGNFTIGSADKPYSGRANITMHGAPNSRDLPMYGAKSLAVRQGVVTFFGQPKVPYYTTLNRTVDPGATSITVNGLVNWQVGDRIVIASSSFYANEVHEATITAIDTASAPGCSVLSLDAPTRYVHLGEIHTQPGGAAPLDMRAEVGVLTRNILLTGDYDSSNTMYGAHVMVSSPPDLPRALVRFDNVEVAQSGQAFRLGRYSIQWHMHGDVAYQSWVRGCSIHHTYSRAAAIHGTYRVLFQNNLAYNVMGHAVFLEDGVESGNIIEGNIGIYTKASDALLVTDTTPATFWITNPNNTVRHNRAAGSLGGYGFWYRLLDNPEGPSYTTTVCPKFTPLVEFTNNTAHSNMFYGLRIHPEYYPRNVPCNGFDVAPFAQQPAVFNGMVLYKNGMKGAVGTQLGLVQFTNFVLGDNGGGPNQHAVNGKDNGASVEMSWIVDDRNRYDVALTEMAGLINATVYARTTTGGRGSAGTWYSDRRVSGIITQSPVQGQLKHSALMSLVNVTFVDFGPSTGFTALEACGKCKTYQGGATTFTANVSFVNSDGSKPSLSSWSWGHQGVYLDTDGTLLNAKTLPDSLLPSPSANWTFGPGTTWHSAVESELFDPAECVYVRGTVTSNNGAYCSPALTFRRVMLNRQNPEALKYKDLKLVSLLTNRTSTVHFSTYNEDGYQFTVATGREYWVHWDVTQRVDPEIYTLHKMDLLGDTNFVYLSTKYAQPKDHFTINGLTSNSTGMPPALPTTPHGAAFYNRTFAPDSWWWGNRTYNDTKFTVFVAGRYDSSLAVAASACPDAGCGSIPAEVVDAREGTLLWSDSATWASRPGGKPAAGDNVTIPYGWDIILDESPPPLSMLVIQGSVQFDPTRDINLTASYILVMNKGSLRAGTPAVPHPAAVTIKLSGTRGTPGYLVDSQLDLGSKVLAAIRGGTIDLFGCEVGQRWVRLNAPASPGDVSIAVSDPNHRWQVGDKVLITSTTYNVWQSEMRRITAIRDGGSTLDLDAPLEQPHGATLKAYPGGPTVDMRAEVALISSNILITTDNVARSYGDGSEYFGARVVVSGNSTGRFSNIAMEYCGQAGLTDRACILFDRLASVTPSASSNSSGQVANPSILRRSALVWGMNSNLRIGGTPGTSSPINITDNVMYAAFDNHGVEVLSSGNIIKGNLVLGTIKDMQGKSGMDVAAPSNFKIWSASNWVENNVAAGSERYGYSYFGVPCSEPFLTGSFLNNSAHSCLAGVWLQASSDSQAEGCTALRNFTAYMNWDFGIITTQGLPTDLLMENVNVLDTKHSGVTVFRTSGFTEKGGFRWRGGLLAGQSSDDVCNACYSLYDPGCHPKLSAESYNREMPFKAAIGLQSAMFALGFTAGPEDEPYDKPTGYAVANGYFNISGVTVADFLGPAGCGRSEVGNYAFANHPEAPEAFHPHFFSQMNVINVPTGQAQGMFRHTPPNPDWRNAGDCGEAVYTRGDGSQILLNCAGPAHVYWRDLDGSLIAGGNPSGAGTIAGVFTQPRVFPMDQGSPVLPGACSYMSAYSSYRCAVNSTAFLLDERLKPKPLPPAGIWGDPQHFVLESRDTDSEDQDFGPVFFNVSGSIDLVTAAMDHSSCTTYTCQKRLSTFWTYLPTFQTVYVNFTGTPSQNFRLWLPYADPNAELVLVFNMLYTLNRWFVWLAPGNGPVSGRMPPQSKPMTVGDGTGHGAFYWDQESSLLYVKIMGGKSLEIRTESALLFSQPFGLTVDQFYATAPNFVANLAMAMGIETNRIYVAKVVPGSSVVTTGVGPKWSSIGALPELQLSAGSSANGNDSAPSPSPSPAASSKAATVSELLDVMLAYSKVVTDPGVAELLGVAPLGPAVSDLSSLASQDALLAQELAAAAQQSGILTTLSAGAPGAAPAPASASTPSPGGTTAPGENPSSPTATPSPAVVTPGQPATDPSTPSREDNPAPTPDTQARSAAKSGLTSSEVGGLVAAIAGSVLIGGVVAGAFVVRKRSRSAYAAEPSAARDPSLAPAPSRELPGPVRSSHLSTTSAHEHFSVPNPTYEMPSDPRRRMSTGDVAGTSGADMGGELGSPSRSSPSATATAVNYARVSGVEALAAGTSAPTADPELIRPVVSPSKQPHSAPLTQLPRAATLRPPEVYRRGRSSVKVPAELQSDSQKRLGRTSAPGSSHRNMAEKVGSLTRSEAGVGPTAEERDTAASVPAQRMSSQPSITAPPSDNAGSDHRASPYLPRMPPRRLPALDHVSVSGAVPDAAPAAEPAAAAGAGAVAAGALAAAASAAATASGASAASQHQQLARVSSNGDGDETMVLPMPRTLETMESFVPRPRSARPPPARPRASAAGVVVNIPGADEEEVHIEFGPLASPSGSPQRPERLVLPATPMAPRSSMVQELPMSPTGETPVLPLERTLETMETFVPRPRSSRGRPTSARPSAAGASPAAAAAVAAGIPAGVGEPAGHSVGPVAGLTAKPASPALEQRALPPGAPPRASAPQVQFTTSPTGETLVIPIARTLETMESVRPRSTRPKSARPSMAGASAAAALSAGPGESGLQIGQLASPAGAPVSPPQERWMLPAAATRPPAAEAPPSPQVAPAGERTLETLESFMPRACSARESSSRPSAGGAGGDGAAAAAAGPAVGQGDGTAAGPTRDAASSSPSIERCPIPVSPPQPVVEQAAGATGETLVIPMERTLETLESFMPRVRSGRPQSARTSTATGGAGAPAVDVEAGAGASPALQPAVPGAGQTAAAAAPPRPAMMLPGGMMEYLATASLVRSEVAAMLLSGGGVLGAAAEEQPAPEAEEQQRSGQEAESPQARSPAGLYSESMRKRSHSPE